MSGAAGGHSAHGHGESGHGDAHGHGSFKDYVTGFVLSVILTAIPFWLVMGNVIADKVITSVIILALAAVQMVVHMIYFLHMNTKSEGGWTFLALIFTVTIVAITLCGSIWVMHHLNANMMPISAEDARHAP
ncbi:cytochrome o ubiquinol oxidase subunit IV [Methylobacterium sp. Leaf118]|uniref:cytochrome o ubiquinol oxidase subunit IV n=1 Tax=Methylobacterium sp. Leaf118 TaxID=2876562 RepID=UPI001E2D1FA8|nr:cytochrome o ubiquinol oxidase subunit IV [Methylobacterium sp. Leaf118]